MHPAWPLLDPYLLLTWVPLQPVNQVVQLAGGNFTMPTSPDRQLRRRRPWWASALLVVLLSACSGGSDSPSEEATADSGGTSVEDVDGVRTPEAVSENLTKVAADPADGPGDISRVIEVAEPEVLKEIAIKGDGVAVVEGLKLDVELDSVEVESRGVPGEFAGEAVTVIVTVINDGKSEADLSLSSVAVSDAQGAPLSPFFGEPSSPLPEVLQVGKTAKGTYVFTLTDDPQEPLTVSISPAPQTPVARFAGHRP